MPVVNRTCDVIPAMTDSSVMGSNHRPSGPVGCLPPTVPPDLGPPVLVQVLAEDHMVGYDHPVDPGLVGGTGPVEQMPPAARVGGREIDELQ